MKNILFILAINLTTYIFGQETQKDFVYSDFKRIQVGISFSPDYNYRTLKVNNESYNSSILIDSRNDMEIAKPGYTTGLNFCFNFKEFLGLETGILYSNKGYQIRMEDINSLQPDPNFLIKYKLIDAYHYIDIPLKTIFTFDKKKIRFFYSIGLTTNIFIKATSKYIVEYSNGRIEQTTRTRSTTGYNKVNISPTISAGFNYVINDRMNLKVEPAFRYGVLEMIDAPLTEYLWNAGLNIGYYFGL